MVPASTSIEQSTIQQHSLLDALQNENEMGEANQNQQTSQDQVPMSTNVQRQLNISYTSNMTGTGLTQEIIEERSRNVFVFTGQTPKSATEMMAQLLVEDEVMAKMASPKNRADRDEFLKLPEERQKQILRAMSPRSKTAHLAFEAMIQMAQDTEAMSDEDRMKFWFENREFEKIKIREARAEQGKKLLKFEDAPTKPEVPAIDPQALALLVSETVQNILQPFIHRDREHVERH